MQIREIRDEIGRTTINEQLLSAAIPYDDVESYFQESVESAYSLKHRVARSGLVRKFINEVEKSQSEFILSIQNSFSILKTNIAECEEMDRILGQYGDRDVETHSDNEVQMLKDGTP